VRRAMGQTLTYTKRIDLAHMSPRGDLVSSGYCLANPGREYLVYSPRGPRLTVNLSGSSGTYTVEWFQPATGKMASGRRLLLGTSVSLRAPFSGPVVLYLVANCPHR
jgi:Putative collagen-binding domain of a collagenase